MSYKLRVCIIIIIIIIKFISQHNKVKLNHNNRIEILAKWPSQGETTYVWPIQQNNSSTYTITRYRNAVGKHIFYQAEQNTKVHSIEHRLEFNEIIILYKISR